MANETDNREDAVIQGHNYDGIQEYDNPMPGWWLWILYASIIFAPIYIIGLHFSDVIPSYEEDLAASQEELAQVREAFREANPVFVASDSTLAPYLGNAAAIDAGAEIYATNCSACHGQAGEGLIGPNLTDEYWIHGGSPTDIFEVITEGVVEKGMVAWGPILTPQQRAELVAYIESLEGTDPAGAKAPEGEPYPPETAT